jgi:multiple sugar transport system permease protein
MAVTAPAAALTGVFFIWPLLRTVWMSLHDWPLLGNPKFIGADNYITAATDSEFLRSAGFTLLYTVLATTLLFIAALVLAMLVKRGTRTARIFQTIYFIPVVIGMASASYLWLYMWQGDLGPASDLLGRLGLADPSSNWFATFGSALGIVLMMVVWKVGGLQMLLLLSGLQSIPEEVNEAARIDGAGRWQTFRYITLPLLRPTLALVLVFSVAGSLLAFDQFYIMTAGGPGGSMITAVYEIYRTSFIQFKLGLGAAMSVMLMVVLGVVSALQMLLLKDSDH